MLHEPFLKDFYGSTGQRRLQFGLAGRGGRGRLLKDLDRGGRGFRTNFDQTEEQRFWDVFDLVMGILRRSRTPAGSYSWPGT